MGVSVVLAVRNEEKNIRRCLESVKWADEIIVVDSNSTDRTLDIAREYRSKAKVRVCQYKKKDYLIEEKKNFGIKKATKDWVLILDADEEVTPELKKEIISRISRPGYNAFNVHFRNYCFGRFLRGSFWSDMPVTRLFRRGKGFYKDTQPHTLLSVQGMTGKLKNPVNHYVYRNTKEFLDKMDRYTSQSAEHIAKSRKGGVLNRPLGNMGIISLYIEPVLFSGWIFFIKRMYRDYFIGMWLSLLMGYYLYTERKKARRLMK